MTAAGDARVDAAGREATELRRCRLCGGPLDDQGYHASEWAICDQERPAGPLAAASGPKEDDRGH